MQGTCCRIKKWFLFSKSAHQKTVSYTLVLLKNYFLKWFWQFTDFCNVTDSAHIYIFILQPMWQAPFGTHLKLYNFT